MRRLDSSILQLTPVFSLLPPSHIVSHPRSLPHKGGASIQQLSVMIKGHGRDETRVLFTGRLGARSLAGVSSWAGLIRARPRWWRRSDAIKEGVAALPNFSLPVAVPITVSLSVSPLLQTVSFSTSVFLSVLWLLVFFHCLVLYLFTTCSSSQLLIPCRCL